MTSSYNTSVWEMLVSSKTLPFKIKPKGKYVELSSGEADRQDEEKQVAQVERRVKESHAGRPRDLLAVGEVQLLA